MARTLIWIVPYILSWIVHLTWGLWGLYLTKKMLGIKSFGQQIAALFGIWFVIVILSSGCPFFYLHQWIELQAGWREKITYRFEDSFVYQYVIEPTKVLYK